MDSQTCLIYVYIERYIASSDFAPFSTPYIYSGLNAVAMYSVEFTLTDRRMQPTRLRYSPLFHRIPWQPCLSTTPLWIYQLLKAFMLMGMPMHAYICRCIHKNIYNPLYRRRQQCIAPFRQVLRQNKVELNRWIAQPCGVPSQPNGSRRHK